MDNRSAKRTASVIGRLEGLPRLALAALSFGILFLVAAVDFMTGYEISCTVFYLAAIGIATWYIGAGFGALISILSAMATSAANVLTGQKYSSPFAAYWDAAVVLAFYLIVVWLLRNLRTIHNTLELRVSERTAVLTSELAERKRLEREILVISEREQQRIGRDIHDSLCQHLTGTALAEQFLLEKLSARGAAEVEDARRVVGLIEDAISMARGLAAGLSPLDTGRVALLAGLNDLAAHFSSQFKVSCRFAYEEPVLFGDSTAATHLYRIAQEAVHNAIRHGKARNIGIRLSRNGQMISLTVTDDGTGLPEGAPLDQGMGLRNMRYRASILGGSLTIGNGRPGAVVTCSFPVANGSAPLNPST